ncbi:retinoblastoma-like protein 1 [Watersipora subatra]|uniref:retinoblastoma-like protein 1 n=1 Tax=Watersipora subatra TaxID=2589382 RepID=UPI00355B0E06
MAKSEWQSNTRFLELCSDLNLDSATKDKALREFDRIKDNYTLEGDPLHWIACALYEACRQQTVPTIDNGEMEGNGVSLTQLLRTAKLSLIQFFNKIKKWADMANLPESFRSRVDKLERNFSVSTVIFKKYKPIFTSVFKDPDQDPPRPPKSRKQRAKPCTSSDIYEFIWKMFVLAKGNFPDIGDDLVNCYHLLLCVIDWVYTNCMLGKRSDLISPKFHAAPGSPAPNVLPCIISQLCFQHEGLEVEAKGIKEHHFKSYIRRLCTEKDILKGTQSGDTFIGILDIGCYTQNFKQVDKAYDDFVLTLGDFDERVFLGKDAKIEIGTPAKLQPNSSSVAMPLDGPSLLLEAAARSNADAKLREHLNNTQSLCPKTPLTGRHHLPENHTEANVTPITTATQGVSKLQALLAGRKSDTLTEKLLTLFQECSNKEVQKSIEERVVSMGQTFCEAYTMPCNSNPGSQVSFAQNRLQFATMLYYKVLENIMETEKKRLLSRTGNKTVDLSGLLEQDIFHRSLFACSLEIVIFCYNSQRTFPWVLAVFDLQPYHFYKVIELLIRAEENFSRDIIKHLNRIEESILDCLAWKSDSPLWDYIARDSEANKAVLPSSEEVSLQQPANPQHPLGSPLGSPVTHPQIRRLALSDGKLVNKKPGELTIYSPGHSPNRAPLASDRFSSPVSGTARRRLFPATAISSSPSASHPVLTAADGHSPAIKQQIITFQQTSTDDGKQILIPVQIVQNVQQPSVTTTPVAASTTTTNVSANLTKSSKSKKTGSLALFLRKVYHLANVRLKDLCDKLGADDQLRRRVWTTFEHCLVQEFKLMKDRHLDQFIMCAVYAICKVSGNDQSFQDIMKCYRLQPQAQSHVYRSVLLRKLNQPQTGSQTTDNLSQQSTDSDSSDRIQDRLNSLRSSSTLPVSRSGSAPPTPTRASGASSGVYENEERGDVIKFYNMQYVKHMKSFILRFQGRDPSNPPALSSLPKVRQHQTSPRRVSNKHPIYVSPHKSSAALSLLTPDSRMLYCFNSSPAKDLRAINNMLKKGDRMALTSIGEKRHSTADLTGAPAIKAIKFDQAGPAS